MFDQQKEVFREEAGELLSELEGSLLELEDAPDDMELVAKVFRSMHTIKGSGAMFGFDDIAKFTHEVETVFDLVRNGVLPVTKELVSCSLTARDHIRSLLDGGQVDEEQGRQLVQQFQGMVPKPENAADSSVSATDGNEPINAEEGPELTYRIRVKFAQNIIFTGTRPDSLLRELTDLGNCRVVAQTEGIPLLDQFTAEGCYVYWDIILTTNQGVNAIRDVFIFVEDDVELKIEVIDDGQYLDADPEYKRIGEILLERGDISRAELDEILASAQPLGQKLINASKIDQGKIEAALLEQEVVRAARNQRQQQETVASVRVPADRLDQLVNLVGEMVTIQSRLSQTAASRNDTELISIAEEVERLTAELRDNTLNIRMLPIGTTFSKFKRLVRDLSQELGKEIELTTAGADTELDKTIIEKLNDPLVHLIRNSIDHGIELPEVRQAAGKKRFGTVHLAAIHSGDRVIIEIRDDGAGLNEESIRRKAIEKGVIGENDHLTRQETFQLIFASGFSTAQKVTGVSGRGVGMDVVKRAIEALRGSIDIDSTSGSGTIIRVHIPLTLAIIESLLVEIGDGRFVIPLGIVEECIELNRETAAGSHGNNLVRVRDLLVPYIHLREVFAIDGEPPAIEQVVITTVNDQRIGFVVDHVIGEHQTVIKSLGRVYRDVPGLSGATILGDGQVALILDAPQLVQAAVKSEIHHFTG